MDSFNIILCTKKFIIPAKFSNLSNVSTDIYNELIFSPAHEYYVKSNVSERVLESFLASWIIGNVPDIRVENFAEYLFLSKEFNLLKDPIQQKEKEFKTNLSYFDALIPRSESLNLFFYEEQVSIQLDNYLQKYGIEMMELPIQTLYNIFSHPNRKLADHNQAYKLINLAFKNSRNHSILILISKLDGMKLNQANLNDSIANKELHLLCWLYFLFEGHSH